MKKRRRNQINIRVGARLRFLRQERELTQEFVAKKIGLDRCTLVNLEFGRQGISVRQLFRFAEIYDCQLGTILEETK